MSTLLTTVVGVQAAAIAAAAGTSAIAVAGDLSQSTLTTEEIQGWRTKLEEAAQQIKKKSLPVAHQNLAAQLQVSKAMVQRRLATLLHVGILPAGIPRRPRGQRPPKDGRILSNIERRALIQDGVKNLRAKGISVTQKNLAEEIKWDQPRLSEWLKQLETVGLYPDNLPKPKRTPRTAVRIQALSVRDLCFGFSWGAFALQALGGRITKVSLAKYLGMSESTIRHGFERLQFASLWPDFVPREGRRVGHAFSDRWRKNYGDRKFLLDWTRADLRGQGIEPTQNNMAHYLGVRQRTISSWMAFVEARENALQPPKEVSLPPLIFTDAVGHDPKEPGEAQREADTARLLKALKKHRGNRGLAARSAGLSLTRARFLIWKAPEDSPIAAYKDPADDEFFSRF